MSGNEEQDPPGYDYNGDGVVSWTETLLSIAEIGGYAFDIATIPSGEGLAFGQLIRIGGKSFLIKEGVNTVSRTKDVLGHIFKNTIGHVNPATASSKRRYLNLFEKVANNSKNLNQSILKPSAIKNGVQGYTQTFKNGQQVWVHSRNGKIFDAGVNLTPR